MSTPIQGYELIKAPSQRGYPVKKFMPEHMDVLLEWITEDMFRTKKKQNYMNKKSGQVQDWYT